MNVRLYLWASVRLHWVSEIKSIGTHICNYGYSQIVHVYVFSIKSALLVERHEHDKRPFTKFSSREHTSFIAEPSFRDLSWGMTLGSMPLVCRCVKDQNLAWTGPYLYCHKRFSYWPYQLPSGKLWNLHVCMKFLQIWQTLVDFVFKALNIYEVLPLTQNSCISSSANIEK